MLTVPPMPNEPSAVDDENAVTVGAWVSYVIVAVELAVLVLPAVSEKTPLETETEPDPLCVFVVGVNTTVYTVEEVDVTDERVPPVTETSPVAKFEDASDSVIVNVEV